VNVPTIRIILSGLLLAVATFGGAVRPAMADRTYLEGLIEEFQQGKEFQQAASRILGATKDQVQVVLTRYGRPDLDDTTAYDQPRPPVVLRWFDYRKAGVRVHFAAKGSMDGPPPYTWILLGFMDTASSAPIPFGEGDRRLRAAKH
jgi:hypothetical protein